MDSGDWYCLLDGETRGPLRSKEVVQLVRQGMLKPAHKIRQGEHGAWVLAGRFKKLFPSVALKLDPLPSTADGKPADNSQAEGSESGAKQVVDMLVGIFVLLCGAILICTFPKWIRIGYTPIETKQPSHIA